MLRRPSPFSIDFPDRAADAHPPDAADRAAVSPATKWRAARSMTFVARIWFYGEHFTSIVEMGVAHNFKWIVLTGDRGHLLRGYDFPEIFVPLASDLEILRS